RTRAGRLGVGWASRRLDDRAGARPPGCDRAARARRRPRVRDRPLHLAGPRPDACAVDPATRPRATPRPGGGLSRRASPVRPAAATPAVRTRPALAHEGSRVAAADGCEGLAALAGRGDPIDAVLLDLTTPNAKGGAPWTACPVCRRH